MAGLKRLAAAMGMAVLVVAAAQAQPVAVSTGPAHAPLTGAERAQIYAAQLTADAPVLAPLAGLDDAALIRMATEFAKAELGLRLVPHGVDRMWAIEPKAHDVDEEFEAARRGRQLEAWLKGLSPASADYRALKGALVRYARLMADGGWPTLASGKPLKPGVRSPQVAVLRKRLATEGYGLADAADAELFDAALQSEVAQFQRRHGLTPDGAVGPATRTALNVPAADRYRQVVANLERMRWTPRDLPPTRIMVDSGLAQATLYRDGQVALTMRAVVGKTKTPTPMFASRLEAVVFNPPWNVPNEIAVHEILPKAARQPGYWASEGFVRTPNGIQQRPGPKNALGQIKFDLVSPFGVYLHDTPSKSAFTRDDRWLSHGCMRLEKPRDLAQAAMGWTGDQIEAAIADGETNKVAMPRPIPLFVIHTTAFVEADGGAAFRPDTYGWDRKLALALEGIAGRRAEGPLPATDCAVPTLR